MGGLSKKAYQIGSIAKKSGHPCLVLDGGALLFKSTRLEPVLVEQSKATAAGIVDAYNLLDFDAVGITGYDLAAGLDFLKRMKEKSKFPWLSANLLDKSTDQPLFTESVIKNVGAIKIGIVGLTGDIPFLQNDDSARIASWQEVLPGLIAKLSKSCDMIILISSYDFYRNAEIAKAIPGIHLIVQSSGSPTNMKPQQVNNTLICQTEKQGKFLGVMDIDWSKSGNWGHNIPKNILQKRNALDRINWQLNRYKKNGDPEVAFKNQQQKYASYLNLEKKHTQLAKEIADLEAAIAREKKSGLTSSVYKNRFIAMETSLPDEQKVLAVVQKTAAEVNAIGRKHKESMATRSGAATVAKGGPTSFSGWHKCVPCHRQQADTWQKSRHAQAYATLEKQQKQFNRHCLPCHVTGVINGAEPFALSLTADLMQVGCENCHGPGQKHAVAPTSFPMVKKPAAPVCLRCHTTEHDGNFSYKEDVRKLRCGSFPLR